MEKFGVIELSSVEMASIDGGFEKPLAYYLGYAVGYVCGEVTTFLSGLSAGLKQK